jgi:two-component system response regulator
MHIANAQPIEVLLVEDNPGDVDLTKEALENGKVRINLSVTHDGFEALDFLRRRGAFAHAPRPDIVLLDLNLPGKDGREVLAEMKGDADLKRIPVVILTTSQAEEDVMQAYNSNANCFISKPVDVQDFVNVVKTIENFWLTIVKLPAA